MTPPPAPTVSLVAAGGRVTRDELRAVVRRRLLRLAVILAGIYAYFTIQRAVVGSRYDPARFPVFSAVMAGVVAANLLWHAAAAWALWRRPTLPLGRLRLAEAGVVGLPFLHQCLYEVYPLYLTGAFPSYLAAGLHPDITARGHALTWFALMIGYGVVVPNTWRRTLAVVAGMAAVALLLNLGAVWASGLLGHPAAARHLVELGVWLAGCVGFVAANAYRIEVLATAAARRLGPYTLTEKLGAGGMGEVFKAEHALLRRPCAVKLIRPEQAGDPATLQRFEREVQATAALAHPNAVRVYDYGRADDGTFYCVMEHLPGVTLDELVRRFGPQPAGRVVYLLRQVAAALGAAHAAGLTHRDVKPGNVIVGDAGRGADFATLLDFGLALDRATGDDRVTAHGTVVGTPAFMAPEQARGDPVDGRADVYALGAVGYFLLAGRPPFAAGAAMQTLAALLTTAPRPLAQVAPGVPADLAGVVHRCLARDPADRYPTADAVEAALAGCRAAGEWSAAAAAGWWDAAEERPAAPDAAAEVPTDVLVRRPSAG